MEIRHLFRDPMLRIVGSSFFLFVGWKDRLDDSGRSFFGDWFMAGG
jgi:hypothetical protein